MSELSTNESKPSIKSSPLKTITAAEIRTETSTEPFDEAANEKPINPKLAEEANILKLKRKENSSKAACPEKKELHDSRSWKLR